MAENYCDNLPAIINEIETLRQQEIESDQLRGRLTSILTRTANELKGQTEPLHMHSWHDLPERAAYAVKAAADAICHAVTLEREIETLRARVRELEAKTPIDNSTP